MSPMRRLPRHWRENRLTMGILFHRNVGGIAVLIVMMLAVGSYVVSLLRRLG